MHVMFYIGISFTDVHVHTGICGKFLGNLGSMSDQFLFEDNLIKFGVCNLLNFLSFGVLEKGKC